MVLVIAVCALPLPLGVPGRAKWPPLFLEPGDLVYPLKLSTVRDTSNLYQCLYSVL